MGYGTASKKLKMYTKQRIGTSDPKSNFIPPLLARNVSISDPAKKYQDRSVQLKVKTSRNYNCDKVDRREDEEGRGSGRGRGELRNSLLKLGWVV